MGEWHEIVIEGPDKVARGFVAGFAASQHEAEGVVFGEDLGLAEESLSERLRDLVGAGARLTVLVPESIAVPLAAALAGAGAAVGLRVARRRRVTSVSFRFTAETYTPEVAETIRGALMGALPEGVLVEDRNEDEHRQPEASGVELYAPKHDYVYRASGRIAGALPGVLEMHRRARDLAFVEAGPLELHGIVLEEHEPVG